MKLSEKHKNEIINHAMDLATNVDRFRNVVILTTDHTGVTSKVEYKSEDSTLFELLGIYETLAYRTKKSISEGWEDNDTPLRD